MAKLILKSIAYYPQALAELPMSHKDLGLIDTDKPYKKLIIPTQSRHLYRLVDQQTGQVLKAQKLIPASTPSTTHPRYQRLRPTPLLTKAQAQHKPLRSPYSLLPASARLKLDRPSPA